MQSIRRALAAACLFACAVSRAEILQGIAPLDSLGDIRHKYPNAVIQPVKAAWVTESQAFFSLAGQGFPGTLYIAFEDGRPAYRQAITSTVASAVASGASAPDTSALEGLANQPDNEALTVSWVRWVPDQPIPLARYRAKYGPPSKCDFSSSDMRPFCAWETRGLLLTLSDDQQQVLNVEATFTKDELRRAWQERYHYDPPWLKEEAPKGVRTPKGGGVKKTI